MLRRGRTSRAPRAWPRGGEACYGRGMPRPPFIVLALSAVCLLDCAGTKPAEALPSVAGACKTDPGDDACDLCTAAKCCPEESACMADSACKSGDDTLDACEAKAEKTGHGLPACYDAFGATGALAKKRADCIRSSCAKECLGTP